MSLYPYDSTIGQVIKNDAGGSCDRVFGACIHLTAAQAAASDDDGIHAAAALSATAKTTIKTGFSAPPYPRNVTATIAAVTASDIAAVKVKVYGKNAAGEDITEELPTFTADTAGSVSGSKAFASVDKVECPAMDGASATLAIGFGEKCGIPFLLPHNTLRYAIRDGSREATAPTIATSATELESNTFTMNSALDGDEVYLYLDV